MGNKKHKYVVTESVFCHVIFYGLSKMTARRDVENEVFSVFLGRISYEYGFRIIGTTFLQS